MFLNFYEAITSAYNANTLTGNNLASLGLIGFIIFGKKGGIIGVADGVLTGIADYKLFGSNNVKNV